VLRLKTTGWRCLVVVKGKRSIALALLAVLAMVLVGSVPLVQGQTPSLQAQTQASVGTAFSYQGQLAQGGSLANGAFDMQFVLYDAAATPPGVPVGPTVTLAGASAVQVVNGIFTVALDFGAVFDGSARYLEVRVKPSGGITYTTLTPRQALTPAPYALTALNAVAVPWTGVTGKPDLQPKYARTVVVGPVGDGSSAVANGTALLNALAGITTASQSNPYLLKIEPGVYDLGTSPLTMKAWVDVEGSGAGVTTVQRAGAQYASDATVEIYVNNTELRFLTIKNTGGSTPQTSYAAVGVFVGSNSARLTHVVVMASGATHPYGVYLFINASLVLRDSTIEAMGGTDATGLIANQSTGKIMVINCSITASGGSGYNVGISDYSAPIILDDVTVVASGGLHTQAVYSSGGSPTIHNSVVTASDAASSNTGIDAWSGGAVTVNNSHVVGITNTIEGLGSTVKVGASKLEGGPATGSPITCAGVYDENYAFYASTCP
jgi:hypothetical protein